MHNCSEPFTPGTLAKSKQKGCASKQTRLLSHQGSSSPNPLYGPSTLCCQKKSYFQKEKQTAILQHQKFISSFVQRQLFG